MRSITWLALVVMATTNLNACKDVTADSKTKSIPDPKELRSSGSATASVECRLTNDICDPTGNLSGVPILDWFRDSTSPVLYDEPLTWFMVNRFSENGTDEPSLYRAGTSGVFFSWFEPQYIDNLNTNAYVFISENGQFIHYADGENPSDGSTRMDILSGETVSESPWGFTMLVSPYSGNLMVFRGALIDVSTGQTWAMPNSYARLLTTDRTGRCRLYEDQVGNYFLSTDFGDTAVAVAPGAVYAALGHNCSLIRITEEENGGMTVGWSFPSSGRDPQSDLTLSLPFEQIAFCLNGANQLDPEEKYSAVEVEDSWLIRIHHRCVAIVDAQPPHLQGIFESNERIERIRLAANGLYPLVETRLEVDDHMNNRMWYHLDTQTCVCISGVGHGVRSNFDNHFVTQSPLSGLLTVRDQEYGRAKYHLLTSLGTTDNNTSGDFVISDSGWQLLNTEGVKDPLSPRLVEYALNIDLSNFEQAEGLLSGLAALE